MVLAVTNDAGADEILGDHLEILHHVCLPVANCGRGELRHVLDLPTQGHKREVPRQRFARKTLVDDVVEYSSLEVLHHVRYPVDRGELLGEWGEWGDWGDGVPRQGAIERAPPTHARP